jgi:hypothetical protein
MKWIMFEENREKTKSQECQKKIKDIIEEDIKSKNNA